MAETDWHRDLMLALIETLKLFFVSSPRVYVSGNLLIFYVPGNKRKHLAPDVFVVKGVSKHKRPNYLVWEEGKPPTLVIELTSSSTRAEDTKRKFKLYQDVLKVQEYFLFDPFGDYLKPSLQGFRLRQGEYRPIRLVEGRLPSRVLGLHLERSGTELRLYDPATGQWVPTPAEAAEQRAEAARLQAEAVQEEAEAARLRMEAENECLRRELAELRRRLDGEP